MAQAAMRRPRFIRQPVTGKSLCFTQRDFTILSALYRYQLLGADQLRFLYQGSGQKTSRRLRELFDAGYIHRYSINDPMVPGSVPYAYALTDRGALWLSEHRPDIEWSRRRYNENNARRTRMSIPHALMISEIMVRTEVCAYYRPERVALVHQHEILAAAPERTRNRRAPTSWNSPIMHAGGRVTVGNRPDYLFGVTDFTRPAGWQTMHFFLEADRGTETVHPTTKHLNKTSFYRKTLAYLSTKQLDLHKMVFGEDMQNFRVLWVVDQNGRAASGKTRLENFIDTARHLTEGRVPNLFLFTTLDALKAYDDPLTHEWLNTLGDRRRILD